MCRSMVDIQSAALRSGKEKKTERKIETTEQKYYGLPYSTGQP